MHVEAQPSDFNSKAIAGCVGQPSKGKIADSLDRYASEDADDGEHDKGAEICQHNDAKEKCRVEDRHD